MILKIHLTSNIHTRAHTHTHTHTNTHIHTQTHTYAHIHIYTGTKQSQSRPYSINVSGAIVRRISYTDIYTYTQKNLVYT